MAVSKTSSHEIGSHGVSTVQLTIVHKGIRQKCLCKDCHSWWYKIKKQKCVFVFTECYSFLLGKQKGSWRAQTYFYGMPWSNKYTSHIHRAKSIHELHPNSLCYNCLHMVMLLFLYHWAHIDVQTGVLQYVTWSQSEMSLNLFPFLSFIPRVTEHTDRWLRFQQH